MSQELRALVAGVSATLEAKTKEANEAYWRLAATGSPEDAKRAAEVEKEVRLFLSDRERYAQLKAATESPTGDPLLDRQANVLYRAYLENQLEVSEITELVERANQLEQLFGNFRGTIDGKAVSNNEIQDVLRNSVDNDLRLKAWRASKQIGPEVAPKLVALVKARNQAARRLGFANYYDMQLTLSEIRKEDLFGLLAQLKRLTDGPFAAAKADLDSRLASRFAVPYEEIRAFHYSDPFFQEVPSAGEVDLNPYVEKHSIEEVSVRFFDSIGLDVRDIIARSDLYEREGKNQHAFCMDIDRSGDVRVLCNLRPTTWWLSTMLHELGHGVYDKYHDPQLPWLLRQFAHINSTEASAMYFGRLTRNADWLHRCLGVPEDVAQESAESLRQEQSLGMLIFVRWVLVMVAFESRLYEDPDQDLNALWWRLVRENQLMEPPADLNGGEWATKIHIATAPVYYHNYLIGEVTASHLQAHIARATGIPTIYGNAGVGQWLRERFYRPGARHPWNQLVAEATGEALNPQYFVTEFVQ